MTEYQICDIMVVSFYLENLMTIGIYAIINKINWKFYIGKSTNIERRLKDHKRNLTSSEFNSKVCNRFLWNAVKKTGIENFEFVVLHEMLHFDENDLCDLELYFMDYYSSCDQRYGYNLRRDSSTRTEVHEETRKLISENNKGDKNPNYGNNWSVDKKKAMSELKKEQYQNGEAMITEEQKKKISEFSKNLWKDKSKKDQMAKNVSLSRRRFGFKQYCKLTGDLIKIWNSMDEIKVQHPDWHDKAIYSVCSGYKKSYLGFTWEKFELDKQD